MITGDDILIEYVSRLVKTLGHLDEDLMAGQQLERMDKFTTHYVWHMPDIQEKSGSVESNFM